jgi:hypothetical protein
MKNLIPLFLLLWVSFACREKEEPVTPEVVSVCNEPDEPVLYGELSDMLLRVVVASTYPERISYLQPTTDTRDGLTFSEPHLDKILPAYFSACKVPETYLINNQIISISGKGYIESDYMRFAKNKYSEDPNAEYSTNRLVFLDDIKVTPVE